jgi:hypothetical protein
MIDWSAEDYIYQSNNLLYYNTVDYSIYLSKDSYNLKNVCTECSNDGTNNAQSITDPKETLSDDFLPKINENIKSNFQQGNHFQQESNFQQGNNFQQYYYNNDFLPKINVLGGDNILNDKKNNFQNEDYLQYQFNRNKKDNFLDFQNYLDFPISWHSVGIILFFVIVVAFIYIEMRIKSVSKRKRRRYYDDDD